MNRHLLVLDLDETLVYGTEEPLERKHDFSVGQYYLYRRPGLESFLATCHSLFELAVWSSSTAPYAESVVSNIFPSAIQPVFVWSRERCTLRFHPESREETWLKDLRKIRRKGYDLDHVLVVDDSEEKLARNYGNLITVEPFFGSRSDTELTLLQEYLRSLASTENVRVVEKRDWRQKVRDV